MIPRQKQKWPERQRNVCNKGHRSQLYMMYCVGQRKRKRKRKWPLETWTLSTSRQNLGPLRRNQLASFHDHIYIWIWSHSPKATQPSHFSIDFFLSYQSHSLDTHNTRSKQKLKDGNGGGDFSPFHIVLLNSGFWMFLLWKS